VPTSLADHASRGTRMSSTMTAMMASRGAVARYRIALREVFSGRDSSRTRPNALTASAMVTTNLNRKRGVSAAVAISGLGPRVAKKMTAARAVATPAAHHHADEDDAARTRASDANALMSSFVSMSIPPESFGNRRQAAMQRDSHCRFAHAETPGCLADRVP